MTEQKHEQIDMVMLDDDFAFNIDEQTVLINQNYRAKKYGFGDLT